MALTSYALYSTPGSYTANNDRLLVQSHAGSEGVRFAPTSTTGELAVTTTGANGTVSVAAGHCVIAGTGSSGYWYTYNDAAATVNIAQNLSGNPRIDYIIIRVTDSTGAVAFVDLQGTPAASPVAPTLTKAGAGGINEIVLASIAIPANYNPTTTPITAGWITDLRPRSYVDSAQVTATTAAGIATQIPSPQLGQMVVDGNGYLRAYDGTTWQIRIASGSYTPTITPTVVGTGGGNTAAWSYVNSGVSGTAGMLTLTHTLVFGTSGQTFPSATNAIQFPTGFTAAGSVNMAVGSHFSTVAASGYVGTILLVSSTAVRPYYLTYNPTLATTPQYATPTAWAATTPATWASGDSLRYTANIPGTLAL